MKSYFLKITQGDFNRDGKVWTSDVIDLYDNDWYRNYSTTKSEFGTKLLDNDVWTGLNRTGSTTSDGGYLTVSQTRYIDTTGRIDIINYNIEAESFVTEDVTFDLDIYTAPSSSASFPSEWASKDGISSVNNIYLINSYRYARFVLNLTTDLDPDFINLNMWVRIEIDVPVIAPMFRKTRTVLDKFPEWMAMRELEAVVGATPSTLGGQFINAVSGEWLDDIYDKLRYLEHQKYIETADITQKAWVYEVQGVPEFIQSVTGDSVQLSNTASLQEFYDLQDDEYGYWWNEVNQSIYTNRLYTTLRINSTIYEQSIRQVWNAYDDIGALLDIFRLEGESNANFKLRILDVYVNRPGVGIEAFKNALRRELNLWKYYGGVPDSTYAGATPNILEMADIEDDFAFFDYNGIPKERFIRLIDELAKEYPSTWGNFRWDNAFWDNGGIDGYGYETLPRLYDATPLNADQIESGIGDGNDLYVFRPNAYTGPRSLSIELRARGKHKLQALQSTRVDFDVYVYGRANKRSYINPPLTTYFTVYVTWEEDIIGSTVPLTSISDSQYGSSATPSSGSETNFFIFTEDGKLDSSINWRSFSTGESVDVTNIELSQIYYVDMMFGKFDFDTFLWDYNDNLNKPFYANFSDRPLFYNPPNAGKFDWAAESLIDFNSATPARRPYFIYKSALKETTGIATVWESEKYFYHIKLNGTPPDNSIQNLTLNAPNIAWDANLNSATPNHRYAVEMITNKGSVFGAYAYNSATPVFLPATPYIAVNDQNNWNSSGILETAATPSSLIFKTNTGSLYPTMTDRWEEFSATPSYTLNGTIDEEGPWRNGRPSPYGNTNYAFETVSLDRDDFDIPNSSDYIVTWVGPTSVNDNNIITWAKSSLVKPAVDDGSDLEYPDEAIVEFVDDDVYHFKPFTVYARLKPGVSQQWNPKVHSGWFYEGADEHYLYARKMTESHSGTIVVLATQAQQSAPIISYAGAIEERQVVFYNNDATPTLSLTNTETAYGTGIDRLYATYSDIENIVVTDSLTGSTISLVSNSSNTNIITTTDPTIKNRSYNISYELNNSFYVDNNYHDTVTDELKTRIVFNTNTTHTITYETSIFDPATPADIALNPMYTHLDEGFIFIDYDQYTLDKVEVKVTPAQVIADGMDYILVTLRSLDRYGNPKPDQTFDIEANYGTPPTQSITTNFEGFASFILTAPDDVDTIVTGILSITGAITTEIEFKIQPIKSKQYRLTAIPTTIQIPADGVSENYIVGKVENSNFEGVPDAVVVWKKDRYIYNIFQMPYGGESSLAPGQSNSRGYVVTDSQGRFSVGPFIAQNPENPGYWIVSLESANNFAGTLYFERVGDVVYWYEYPDTNYGVENISHLPRAPKQMATPPWELPDYVLGTVFPVTYDDATPYGTYTPGATNWTPPAWYAVDKYKQYQMGLLGTSFDNIGSATPTHPEYKES